MTKVKLFLVLKYLYSNYKARIETRLLHKKLNLTYTRAKRDSFEGTRKHRFCYLACDMAGAKCLMKYRIRLVFIYRMRDE